MVEYGSGRGWPRRSAYDNFDEDTWMESVRERLRSALYTPIEPRKTAVQLEEASESEHTEEEDEIQEDPSAKNHVRLTSEAMQELFALGGVVEQGSGSSVRLDDFAERVWRVDQPQDNNSASSLFQAFDDGSGSDIDAILRHRMRTQPQKEPAGEEHRIQRPLIQEISLQSPEQSEMEESDIAASGAFSEEESQDSETEQESISEASSSSQSDSVGEEQGSNVTSDELAEVDEMEQELDDNGSDSENAHVSVAEYTSSQVDSDSMEERIDAHLYEEAREFQHASKDASVLPIDDFSREHEVTSSPFDSYKREHGYRDYQQPQPDSFDASALHPDSHVASHGQITHPILVFSESEEEPAEGEVSDTKHGSIDGQAEIMEEVVEDEDVERGSDSENSQDTEGLFSGSNKEDDANHTSLESSAQATNGESRVTQPFQHETLPTGKQHSEDHRISADAVEEEIKEKRKAVLTSLSGKTALKNQESDVNVESSLPTTSHSEDDLATELLSKPPSGSHNSADPGDLTQYTQSLPELANMLDHNVSADKDSYVESTDLSDKDQPSNVENIMDEANQQCDSTKTIKTDDRTLIQAPSPVKTDMEYYHQNLGSQDKSEEKQHSSHEDVSQGPPSDFPEGAWRAFVSDGCSPYAFAAPTQGANAANSNHPVPIAPLIHRSETGDELQDESQKQNAANLPGLMDPSTSDIHRGKNTDSTRNQDLQATVQLMSEDDKSEEDTTYEQNPASTNNNAQIPAHVGASNENGPYRYEDQVELEQQPYLEDHKFEQDSSADSSTPPDPGSSSPIRNDSDSVHAVLLGQDIPLETKGQEKQSDSSRVPNSQAPEPSLSSLPTEEQEIRTEPHRNHYPITRSHCHSQRLVLLRETGSPTFIVPSCVLDPEVLAKEGAEKQDVNIDRLDLVTLNPDALPESVYHTLCRIVSPSLLDEVSVTSDSHAASWMIDDARHAQSDASSEKDDEQTARPEDSSFADSSTGAFNTVHRAPTRGHRRPRKSDSSSGIANYIPPDQPDRSPANTPADVSIEELEQLPTTQPKRARTSSPAPRMRLRRADERRPTQRYSPEYRVEQQKHEEAVREAVAEVVKLGYPEQGIYRQELVWGDTDQFRHVNNVHYIRWLESARMHWLKQLGKTIPRQLYEDIEKGQNIGVILATNFCRYRRPLLYPDTVLIGQAVKLPLVRNDRFSTQSVIYSVNQRAVAAEGENQTVCYDYNKLSKANMPEELRKAIEAWGLGEK
ncbi:hypothetical protein MPSI1_000979 [Malassezia psittaci]|uniref:Thioesterase domain-containing protein n=1 Tax=Malassezia psittaci TaxID=1821823 RepID=A0AAF0FCN8_9BASI|nr:hypothetical protein MPSI1_000979 [Malassezia psittaci]